MFHQLRLQFLTRRGHMQHASSFPARLKHRPPVSSHLNEKKKLFLLLSSQFWPMPSMSRGVINCAKQFLSHPVSRIKSLDQWAVDRDPVLTSTTSAKIGKTAIHGCTSQTPNVRPSCKNTCADSVQVDASNHVGLNVRRRPPEPYEVSPRAPRFFASTPATCTSSGKN